MNKCSSSQIAISFGLALAVASVLGCGGDSGAKNRPKVYPITGKVTYKGAPVVAADVTFICEAADRSAFGRTDSQGNFKLTTFSSNDGAVEGKHVITVVKIEQTEAAKPMEPTDPAYNPDLVAMPAPPPPRSQIPQKYANVKTTDLFAVVSPEGNPEMNLELKD